MLCGHCGTPINPGFTTCPACGAVYRRRLGFLATFPATLGAVAIVFGALVLATEDRRIAAVPFIVAGVAALLLGRHFKRRTPYLWYRREP